MRGFCWERSEALEHRLGCLAFHFQPQIPLHQRNPVIICFAFPQDLSLHLPLKSSIQSCSSDQVRRASRAHYHCGARSAWLFLGGNTCEMSPHHPKGTAWEQLSLQQPGGPCSVTSTCAEDDLRRKAEEVHVWAQSQHQRGD